MNDYRYSDCKIQPMSDHGEDVFVPRWKYGGIGDNVVAYWYARRWFYWRRSRWSILNWYRVGGAMIQYLHVREDYFSVDPKTKTWIPLWKVTDA